ncbi:MAG: flagellar hook-basal body complex protein [Campylobacterales bacterium]
MMRSLWSGVSGMQAHQVAMDVEGNNIANVNTIGFKYARTNFADMLAQTIKPATAPATLGGKNPMQVGLGTSTSSITNIFSQGSTQNTDRATDVAIQGDGFFIVSGDDGRTYKYTRAGDFSLDAQGNFVNADGYIVQGWTADFSKTPYIVDTNASIRDIKIPAGLTTPAKHTENISIKGALNSGDIITEAEKKITSGGFEEYFKLTKGNDFTVKFATSANSQSDTVTLSYDPDINEDRYANDGKFASPQGLVDELNNVLRTGNITGADGSQFVANMNWNAGQTVSVKINGGASKTYNYGTGPGEFDTPDELIALINADYPDYNFTYDESGRLVITNSGTTDITELELDSTNTAMKTILTEAKNFFDALGTLKPGASITSSSPFALQRDVYFELDSYGKLKLVNNTGSNLTVTFGTGQNDNPILSKILQSLNTTSASTIADGETVISRYSLTNYDDVAEMFNVNGRAFNLVRGENFNLNMNGVGVTFEYIPAADAATAQVLADGGAFSMSWIDGQQVTISINGGPATTYTYGTGAGEFDTPTELINLINADYNPNVTFEYDTFGRLVIRANSGGSPITSLSMSSTNSSFDDILTEVENKSSGGVPVGSSVSSDTAFMSVSSSSSSGTVVGRIQDKFADAWGMTAGQTVEVTISDGTNTLAPSKATFTYGSDFTTPSELLALINNALRDVDRDNTSGPVIAAEVAYDSTGKLILRNTGTKDLTTIAFTSTNSSLNTVLQEISGSTLKAGSSIYTKSGFVNGGKIYFTTSNDLVRAINNALDSSLIGGFDQLDTNRDSPTYMMLTSSGALANAVASIDSKGRISISNLHSSSALQLEVTQGASDNTLFTETMSSLTGTIQAGVNATTQPIYAASFTTTIDIFDSLGSKHTLTMEFRKDHTAASSTDFSTWRWRAHVPEPASLNGLKPGDIVEGTISFLAGGGLASVNPTGLRFDPNNGAELGQQITLNFGSFGGFDGFVISDSASTISNMSQDGYAAGDLSDVRVDQMGNLVGSFTNGRSFNLAKIALAKFQNNEGLYAEGGSLFSQSANSGEPIIGFAGTGGRGMLQAQALEMSNVDLSRSMTQLIVIQRGYQANSKTITTSDQMLQALLQLKQ